MAGRAKKKKVIRKKKKVVKKLMAVDRSLGVDEVALNQQLMAMSAGDQNAEAHDPAVVGYEQQDGADRASSARGLGPLSSGAPEIIGLETHQRNESSDLRARPFVQDPQASSQGFQTI